MLFLIILGVLVLIIAFFHYVQGFFSAALSAILAIIAAVLAFSWHEPIANNVLKNNMANTSYAVTLIALFAIIYLVLRIIFDKAIPGNIRLPAAADKIGAALMGLVAGAFGAGIIAIAAQEMPFGPAIGGYARYTVNDQHAYVKKANGRSQDSTKFDELQADSPGKFDDSDRHSAYVDDLVVGTVQRLSESGSLQGEANLTAYHPDFLQELFGQRLGDEPGSSRTAVNAPGAQPAVTFTDIYEMPSAKVEDYLTEGVRVQALHAKYNTGTVEPGGSSDVDKLAGIRKDQILVVVRVLLNRPAADKADWLVRFSPGSVRLVAHRKSPTTGEMEPADYYPIGSVQNDKLLVCKLDDFLFADLAEKEQRAIDLMFAVDKSGFVAGNTNTIADGTFIEFKRMAREDLGGKKIENAPKPLDKSIGYGVLLPFRPAPAYVPKTADQLLLEQRQRDQEREQREQQQKQQNPVQKKVNQATTPTAPQNNQRNGARGSFTSPQANVQTIGGRIFNYARVEQSNLLPMAVAVPSADLNKPTIALPEKGLQAIVKDRKFLSLTIEPKVAAAQLGTGDFKTRELAIPDGQVMIQIIGNTPSDPWAWAPKANAFELVGSDNKRYKAHGVWAVVHQGSEDRLMGTYSADYEAEPLAAAQGQPTSVTLAFLVPDGVKPKELDLDNQPVKDLTDEQIRKGQ